MKGFKNSNIYVEGEGIIKTSLLVKGELINKIGDVQNEEGLIELPDNLIVIPGLIDEHMHGSCHQDTMTSDIEGLTKMSESLLEDGVAGYCATTMTMSLDDTRKALKTVDKYINQYNNKGAKIVGVHLEGPFISKEYKGAQPEEYIIKSDRETFRDLYRCCSNVRLMTLAYENFDDETLEEMVKCYVRPSIGHSNCPSELLEKGIDKGIRCSTHTFNAQKPFNHREVGVVGQVLSDDRVMCELIGDLIHVSPKAIKILYKCKGPKNIILVTDSMEAKHLEEGKYMLGGQDVFVKDGVARLENGTIAGSILRLNEGVRNVRSVLGISLTEAVDMATINPAKNLFIDDITGSIKVGKRANFAVVDDDMNVYMTVVEGELRYVKEGFKCQ